MLRRHVNKSAKQGSRHKNKGYEWELPANRGDGKQEREQSTAAGALLPFITSYGLMCPIFTTPCDVVSTTTTLPSGATVIPVGAFNVIAPALF